MGYLFGKQEGSQPQVIFFFLILGLEVGGCHHTPHRGADFFLEGGKKASKFVVPPKMALGFTFCTPRGGKRG